MYYELWQSMGLKISNILILDQLGLLGFYNLVSLFQSINVHFLHFHFFQSIAIDIGEGGELEGIFV